jgi:hypothetical protein
MFVNIQELQGQCKTRGWREFQSLFGGYLIAMNIMRKDIMSILFKSVKKIMSTYRRKVLPFLRSRCKDPSPFFVWWSSYMFRFMIPFTLCFMKGKGHGWGIFPKCKVGTWLLPPPMPLVLGMPSPRGFTQHLDIHGPCNRLVMTSEKKP